MLVLKKLVVLVVLTLSYLAGAGLSLSFTATVEKSKTKQTTTTKLETNTITLTVKANSVVCVEYSLRMRTRYDEEGLEISYKGKKFTGYRLKQRQEQGTVEITTKDIGISERCT